MTVTTQKLSFSSGDTTILVEAIASGGEDRRPAVLMLHGADGLKVNTRYREGAHAFAAAGYRVYLIHYLDRTEEWHASLATLFQNFNPWLETVGDALDWMSQQPEVDAERIGIVGVSLGAALGLIASSDPRVKALIAYYGPLPFGTFTREPRLPPTLILHGALDAVVPVANAYALDALLTRRAVTHDIHIYPGQGHGFRGKAQADAIQRVIAFLRTHMPDDTGSPVNSPLPVEV
ncbi:dienelactone hydrolase family protein [Microvirga flavescens]|uniref:dienelactone hydrolase family protein n=1 Tax=Microvirga flavescens TaxID=2249811 RepID=UPI000DDA666E|nr:dienelactone hydrolase family protein [Microvirga flavescens]